MDEKKIEEYYQDLISKIDSLDSKIDIQSKLISILRSKIYGEEINDDDHGYDINKASIDHLFKLIDKVSSRLSMIENSMIDESKLREKSNKKFKLLWSYLNGILICGIILTIYFYCVEWTVRIL